MLKRDRQQDYINNLAKSKLRELSPECIEGMRNSRRQIELVNLPDAAQVAQMNHKEILDVLRLCPAS